MEKNFIIIGYTRGSAAVRFFDGVDDFVPDYFGAAHYNERDAAFLRDSVGGEVIDVHTFSRVPSPAIDRDVARVEYDVSMFDDRGVDYEMKILSRQDADSSRWG